MSKKKSASKEEKNQYLLSLVLLVFILFSGITAFLFYGNRGVHAREEKRQETLSEIVQEIESHYKENGRYPGAVFFTTDKVLICSSVDCIDEKEIPLKGVARASDLSETTTSKSTKYGYVLKEEEYSIGYCDEDGNVYSSGNLYSSELLLNCN